MLAERVGLEGEAIMYIDRYAYFVSPQIFQDQNALINFEVIHILSRHTVEFEQNLNKI